MCHSQWASLGELLPGLCAAVAGSREDSGLQKLIATGKFEELELTLQWLRADGEQLIRMTGLVDRDRFRCQTLPKVLSLERLAFMQSELDCVHWTGM